MSITYDAPNEDAFIAAVKVSVHPKRKYPFREDLTAIIYDEQYVQRAEYFEPLALSTLHPTAVTAYLVKETNPQADKAGLVKWTRSFATVPDGRTEFLNTSGTFPSYQTDSATPEDTQRAGFSETCVGRAVFSYIHTLDPSADLTITEKFQPLDVDGEKCSFVASDTTPTKATYEGWVLAGTYIQTSQTKVKRWKGNIWEMLNIQVKAL